MNITDIRIRKTYEEGRLRALVSLTLDGVIAIHDIKVSKGNFNTIVSNIHIPMIEPKNIELNNFKLNVFILNKLT